jgi:hypothetical protein
MVICLSKYALDRLFQGRFEKSRGGAPVLKPLPPGCGLWKKRTSLGSHV